MQDRNELLQSLINDLASGSYTNNVLDLRSFKLTEPDVKQLIDALKSPFRNYGMSFELKLGQQRQISFNLVSQLRRACMAGASPALPPHNEKTKQMILKETPISFKDKYGNDSQRALFETNLAIKILEAMPMVSIKKVNDAIVSYIYNNPQIQEKMRNEVEGIIGFLWSEKLISSLSVDRNSDPVETYIKMLQEPENIPTCITLQKIFFEVFFEPSLVKSEKNTSATIPTLSTMSQSIFQDRTGSSPNIDNKLLKTLQPESQFSEVNRGRKEVGREQSTTSFGITESSDTPNWAKNYHKRPIPHAKDRFVRDEDSDIVAFFEKNNIPFIAGPSGTVAYALQGILSLVPQELKSYLNILAASEVALGHHSFYEIMLVANNLKLYSFLEIHESTDAKKKISLSSQLDPEYLYDRFLSESFKETAAYKDLATNYPNYLKSWQHKLDK